MKAILIVILLCTATSQAQFIDPKKIDLGFYGIVKSDTIYCTQIIFITNSGQLVHKSKVKYVYKYKNIWYDDKKKKVKIFMYKWHNEPWEEIDQTLSIILETQKPEINPIQKSLKRGGDSIILF